MRIASYNVHGCTGTDRRHAPHRVARVIAEIGADVIALQEVDSRPRGEFRGDSFRILAAATGLYAVAGPNIVEGRGCYGNLLLSRWRPVAVRRIDLAVGAHEPRGAIDVDLLVDGAPLRVIATHLGLRARERREQIARLFAAIAADPGPTVLLGDFNIARWRGAGPFGETPRTIAPRTFPSRFPVLALDRIWVRPDDAISRLAAHRSALARTASDHLPIIAEIDTPLA